MKYVVEVQHGPYKSTEVVFAEDEEEAIGKARQRTRKYRTLPMAYEHFRVVSESEEGA
jgi:hypothetical protein